jgi:hypothetical protein
MEPGAKAAAISTIIQNSLQTIGDYLELFVQVAFSAYHSSSKAPISRLHTCLFMDPCVGHSQLYM